MGKRSKRRSQQRYEDIVNDDALFEMMEEGGGTRLEFSLLQLFFIQLYSILLISIPWMSVGGNKGPELPRDRRPFEEKIECKLSSYLFRRIYRMSNASFHKLHEILEPKLNEIFFPRGGGYRKPGQCFYLIDTKTRLSIAVRFLLALKIFVSVFTFFDVNIY